MKNIVKYSTPLLILSGLVLALASLRENNLLIWIHILLGFGYSVLFLLFSIDHIITNKNNLLSLNKKSLLGLGQILFGAVVLITGFIIYLYGSQVISPWSEIHFWSTLCFLFTSGGHFFLK